MTKLGMCALLACNAPLAFAQVPDPNDSSESALVTNSETLGEVQVGDAQHRLGCTGLVLAISRQLVRLMGSDIEVESRVSEGNTIRFELELPEASIRPEVLQAVSTGMQHVDSESEAKLARLRIAPQQEAIQELHLLALSGNMRDSVRYAEHISGLDPSYKPFAACLRQLARSYQSKAILSFVEEYLL